MSSKKKLEQNLEVRLASEIIRILGEFDHKNFPKIAVALSGGCDSLALTFLMRNFCAQRNIELIALTVNHQMRNNSSAQIFALKQLLSKHQIACEVLTIDKSLVPKRNIEAKLRELRYELLTSFCQKNDIKLLLFAHHLNDAAENFLIRLFRGSGIDGLSTMQEKQEISGILAVRPLLNFTKNDLQNFLQSLELEWFEDETNADEKFLRNKIRRLLAEFPEQNLIAARIKKASDHISKTRDLFDDLTRHWQAKILVEISPKINKPKNSTNLAPKNLNQISSSVIEAQELVEPKSYHCEILEMKEMKKSVFLNRFELANCPKEIALKILALALMKVSGKPYKPRLEKLQNFYYHLKFRNDSEVPKTRTFYGCISKSINSAIVQISPEKSPEKLLRVNKND